MSLRNDLLSSNFTMAVAIRIFILFLGVVIVKSNHLHQQRHRRDFLDNIYHIIGDGLFGNGDSQSDGLNSNYDDKGQEGNNAPPGIDYQDYGQFGDINTGSNIPDQSNGLPNGSQTPDVNFDIAVPNGPQTPDANINIAVPNKPKSPVVHYNIAVPNAPPSPDVNLNIAVPNGPQLPNVHFTIAVPNGPHTSDANFNITVPNNSQSPDVYFDIAMPNKPQPPDVHFNIPVPNTLHTPDVNANINIAVPNELPTSDVQGLNNPANKGSVNNVNAVANKNGQGDESHRESNDLENHVDINQSQNRVPVPDNVEIPNTTDDDIKKGIVVADPELKTNINETFKSNISDEAQGQLSEKIPGLTGDNIAKDISTKEPKLSHNIDESQFSKNIEQSDDKKTVPEFNDGNIKNGTLMIDPQLKNNETDVRLHKYSDAVVFPDDVDEAKKQHQVNTDDKQSLPNKFNAGDSNKEYPSAIAPVGALTTLSASNYNPSQSTTPNNNEQTSSTWNNQGTQNQYTKPNSVIFGQSLNQQVPVNNGNGSPYVNVVGDPNSEYITVNIPNNNYGQNPSQGYISVNSGSNNPGQSYVSVKPAVNNPVLSYVSGSSGLNNPGQAYIPVNVNSGGTNPGQIYVVTDGGNSQVQNPGQLYVSGINNQGQIYVPVNSGANNPGQIYIPSSGSQTTSGGYYKVIQLSNGQTVLVPVNGNGQNTQWNGQSNNGQILYVPVKYNSGQGYQTLGNNPTGSVVTLGSSGMSGNVGTSGTTKNVPLLISYKEKDGEDDKKSTTLDQDDKKKEKEE